ncbi:MAG: amidohydrolase family protein [Acidimicrobiia bacterium]|nr:amidohydrolase family protein [Acidimicrobiia bacterium]
MLNPERRGAHSEQHLQEPPAQGMEEWLSDWGVAMVMMAPELSNALNMIRELVSCGTLSRQGIPAPSAEEAADAYRSNGAEAEMTEFQLGDSRIMMVGDEVRNEQGVLAGSCLTMRSAVSNLMDWTGCQIVEALVTATTTPACVIGAHTKGELVEGKDADIIALNEDFAVCLTIVEGHVAYDPRNLVQALQ